MQLSVQPHCPDARCFQDSANFQWQQQQVAIHDCARHIVPCAATLLPCTRGRYSCPSQHEDEVVVAHTVPHVQCTPRAVVARIVEGVAWEQQAAHHSHLLEGIIVDRPEGNTIGDGVSAAGRLCLTGRAWAMHRHSAHRQNAARNKQQQMLLQAS